MLNNIKAVIFDLDGTIIDSMWIWKDIDVKYLERKGIDLPKDLQRAIEGMSYTETAHYFKERFNLSDSIETIKREWHEMAEDYYKNKILLKEGVKEFINQLKLKNMKLGIGTSNSRELAEAVLRRHEIIHYFDTIRTSCEVGRGKPYPDIFLKVAEDLKVDPRECIVFEDTYAGVLAATRAGMKVVGVKDPVSIESKDEICQLAIDYIENYYKFA